ncbi:MULTISPECIES: prepilin-type N-terminal cleavage/methylation domain-containing protein [Ottowia]|jgi:general secretion pathway protein I|uniref:type IV pilus modification PilV family protein n=1 Tax=Ottowia TaxID=219181 RepID=UPI002C5B1B4A|nr:prepilin-type N-terminal cleavage/methylation domain-containing protein [Ottowia sp.]HRN75295.1 prepilin-type N-terminal cleavage/methylation domain-containing protein [Ottowia sp.]HRQ02493.1 prepilin-type N-terminal cleavage/methylation domain-containing protein [Ottowia sp.]
MKPRARGFSLLEVLVAFSIMALSLGVLYRALGGSASQTGALTRYEGATLLSQSLLDAYDSLPPGGVSAAGESAGYGWQAQSQPIATPANANPQAVRLHELRLTVHWVEGARERALELLTLRPERKPEPGGRLP